MQDIIVYGNMNNYYCLKSYEPYNFVMYYFLIGNTKVNFECGICAQKKCSYVVIWRNQLSLRTFIDSTKIESSIKNKWNYCESDEKKNVK